MSPGQSHKSLAREAPDSGHRLIFCDLRPCEHCGETATDVQLMWPDAGPGPWFVCHAEAVVLDRRDSKGLRCASYIGPGMKRRNDLRPEGG